MHYGRYQRQVLLRRHFNASNMRKKGQRMDRVVVKVEVTEKTRAEATNETRILALASHWCFAVSQPELGKLHSLQMTNTLITNNP